MSKRYIDHNGVKWYCLTIFYNKLEWLELLSQLRVFYLSYKLSIDYFCYKFSTLQGDRLDVMMTFKTGTTREDEMERFFVHYIDSHPSSNKNTLDWVSHSIWKHYDNNSLEWKKAHIPHYLLRDTALKRRVQTISLLGLELAGHVTEISIIPLFLMVRLLKYPIARGVDVFQGHNPVKGCRESGNIGLLDTYLNFQPNDSELGLLLSEWDRENAESYEQEDIQGYFLDMYVTIRDQYSIGDNYNEQFSYILKQYNDHKIKEQT